MHQVIDVLLKRKSIRAYEKREIEAENKELILQAAMRAPTAGNLMLYSIIDVTDQAVKDTLAKSCDDQPFIARAPMVWIFVADYQRWWDYFSMCGVEQLSDARNEPVRKPAEGDLFLACCDALIAAQNAAIAAESLGIGTCYIGDIMEQYEIHRALLNLPQYAFPICMLCFGYPTEQQVNRQQTDRFDKKFVCFENQYQRLSDQDFEEMFSRRHKQIFNERTNLDGSVNVGQVIYRRKFNSSFTNEMTRSVRLMLKAWMGE